MDEHSGISRLNNAGCRGVVRDREGDNARELGVLVPDFTVPFIRIVAGIRSRGTNREWEPGGTVTCQTP